jgi:hypothetical protein
MTWLTKEEQGAFREDFREKEREIQRYIGFYISGLILLVGWIVGPNSKPLLRLALDNDAYNIYPLLGIVVLNILFTCFLIYKSLTMHEIMQFMTYSCKPDTGFQYWEAWHRSTDSATIRVRAVYTVMLGLLPLSVSFLILFGLWQLLNADPQFLANKLQELEPPGSTRIALMPQQLESVFNTAVYWFWVVAALHVFPIWFFIENVIPTGRRWDRIRRERITGDPSDPSSASGSETPASYAEVKGPKKKPSR